MDKNIRVLITDDHRIIREGLRSLLSLEENLEIVGEASNGAELLDMLANTPVDVVLLDISMPVLDGFETTSLIRQKYPEVKVIALSMLDDLFSVQRMIDSGAIGYVLKNTGRAELSAAIKLAVNDTPFICSAVTVAMLQKMSGQQAAETITDQADDAGLSKREMEILTLIAQGYTNAEMADKLFVSKRTIETHRQNILYKTKTRNTAHLIKYAMEHRMLNF